MTRGARSIVRSAGLAAALCAAGPVASLAETRLFITNHVHSNQVAGLAEWQGRIAAATLGGIVLADPATGAITKLLSAPGGLPSNRVLSIAVSPSGSLWAGTADRGIARLEPGGRFRRALTSFDGLPSDRVQALYVHGDSVWVGTSGGVALFTENPATRQVVLRRSDTRASTAGALVSDDVLAFQDVGDTVWCGTSSGLSTFAGGSWMSRSSQLGVSVRSLALHQDTLWAATASGPRRYAGGVFTLVSSGFAGSSLSLHSDGARLVSGSTVEAVYRNSGAVWSPMGSGLPGKAAAFLTLSTGALWAGTDRGLARYEPGSDTWTAFRAEGPAVNGTQRAAADARGVWFATGNFVPVGGGFGAVLHYDGRRWSAWTSASTGGSLQAASVFAILSDRAGVIWLGHCCGGGDPKPRTERVDPGTGVWETLDATNLYALAQAPSGLVYGGSVEHGNGVYVFDGTTGALLDSLTPLNTQGGTGVGLASNNLRGIAFDAAGRGFFAHAMSGLDIWDGRGTIAHDDDVWIGLPGTGFPSPQTTSVVTTGPSSGWVGTAAGLVRIRNGAVDPTVTDATNAALPALQIHDLALDSRGNLWVATLAGLARVDAQSGAVEHWGALEGLAGDDVLSLAWDGGRGVLWVGTAGGISEVLPAGAGIFGFDDGSYLYPNPLDRSAGALRLGGITNVVTGEIRDLSGALIRRFRSDPAQNVIWDLRLADGSPAASGVYLVVLRDGDRSRTLRAAVVR